MQSSVIFVAIFALWVGLGEARPGHFYYAYPAASQQTTVLRDGLGNQATAYSYNDGHSSSVAVSRNDVSKHLAYVPAVAAVSPVAYEEPYAYHPAIPAYYEPSYYY